MNALPARLVPVVAAACAGGLLAGAFAWPLGPVALAVGATLGGGMAAAGVILWLLADWSLE